MLQELAGESENQDLKMNKLKTNVLVEHDTPIYVNNTQIENGENYVYLGQRYITRDKKQDKEIQRRITAGWTAFAKHRDIFKGNIGTRNMLISSNDMRRGNMGTHQPSKEQASSRTNKDVKEYVKHHIPYRDRNKNLVKRKEMGHRLDRTSQKTEVDLGRTRQQDTR